MSKIIVVDPFDYVVVGGTGDLAKRKLFPALFHRELDGQLPEQARIIGVARSELSDAEFVAQVEAALREFVPEKDLDADTLKRFLGRFAYMPNNAFTVDGYRALKEKLDEHPDRVRVIYLATPPSLFGPISAFLAEVGLNGPKDRLVLEKPLGHDLSSSQEINAAVAEAFDESQVYRIDHYLGKESVQNLMALRFGNVLFESIWSKAVVDHVQITVAEDIGAGDRATYYSKSGALRDMVQNHLAQLLCLTAMEAPASMDADSVRDEKLKVLRALRPFSDEDFRSTSSAGSIRRVRSTARRSPVTPTSWVNRPGPRPTLRSRPLSITGAGRGCRSTCAPVSGCRSAPPKLWFTSRRSRIRFSAR